jgi:TolB protein
MKTVDPARIDDLTHDTSKGAAVTSKWLVTRSAGAALVAIAISILGAVTASSTALATTPGTNGKIAFSGYLADGQTTRAVFVVNPDGSDLQQITHPPAGIQDQNPDWSADGKRIAFSRCSSRCEVRVVDAAGGAPKRVGPNCQNIQPPACEDRDSPAWSPNDKTLAMDHGWGAVQHNTIKHSGIALVDPAGRHVRELITSPPFWGDIARAHWAPNGTQLVIEEDDGGWKARGPGKGHRALFIIDSNGSGLRRVTPWSLDAGDADWSPDGTQILFRTEPGDNDDVPGGNLFTIHPDGTGLEQITHFDPSTLVLSSSFSPDGQAIVFAKSGLGGAPDIFVMNADGTGIQPVTNTPLMESQADWGPSNG